MALSLVADNAKNCRQPRFDDRREAYSASRSMYRHKQVRCNVKFCENCDAFHISGETAEIDPRQKLILQRLAQGMRAWEIGQELSLSQFAIEGEIKALNRHFGAISRPNLIAIAITLGLVDVSLFMPQQKEKASGE